MDFIAIFEILSALLIVVLIWIALSGLYFDHKLGVASVPIMPWVRRKVIELALSHCPPKQTYSIADIGCGWGGMLGILAKKYPYALLTGYEIATWPLWICRLRFLRHSDRVFIHKKNFMDADLREFDLLFCYLTPAHMNELAKKFTDARSGQVLISASFELPGYRPVETVKLKGPAQIPVYVYKFE